MKITCNHFDSKNATFTCQTCKHYTYCSLMEPTTKNHSMLLHEIQYWKMQLKQAKENLMEYENVWNDIHNHEYDIPVNVYGNIQYVPKQNVFGVFIKKPEHAYYGWSAGKLMEKKEKLMEYLRLLNRKELNMRRILERRMNYGV